MEPFARIQPLHGVACLTGKTEKLFVPAQYLLTVTFKYHHDTAANYSTSNRLPLHSVYLLLHLQLHVSQHLQAF